MIKMSDDREQIIKLPDTPEWQTMCLLTEAHSTLSHIPHATPEILRLRVLMHLAMERLSHCLMPGLDIKLTDEELRQPPIDVIEEPFFPPEPALTGDQR